MPRSRLDALCTREELYRSPFARWIIREFLKTTKSVTWRRGIKLFSVNDFIKYIEKHHGVFIYPYYFRRFFGNGYSNVFKREKFLTRITADVYTVIATFPDVRLDAIIRCLVACEMYRYKIGHQLSGWTEDLLFDLEALQEEVYSSIRQLIKSGHITKWKENESYEYMYLHERGKYRALNEYKITEGTYHILRMVKIPTRQQHRETMKIVESLYPQKIRIPRKIRKLDESKKSLTPKEKRARLMGRRVGVSYSGRRFSTERVGPRDYKPIRKRLYFHGNSSKTKSK